MAQLRDDHGAESGPPDRASSLASFLLELGSVESTQGALQCAAKWVPRLVPADRLSVAQPGEDETRLKIHVLVDCGEPAPTHIPIAGSIVGAAFLSGEVGGTDDAREESIADSAMLVEKGLLSSRTLPLISRGETIGTLNLGRREAHGFTHEDEALLQQLAPLIAAQLRVHQRAELASDEVAQLKRAKRNAWKLSQLALALSPLETEQEIVQAVADVIHDFFDIQRVSLAFASPEADFAEIVALSGHIADLGEGARFPLAGSGIQRCLLSRKLEAFPDLTATSLPEHGRLIAAGLRSGFSAPLQCGQEILGTLNIGRQIGGHLSVDDQVLLMQLASLVAHALVGVRTYQSLRLAQEEAESLAEAKGSFLANVSHELRTPLNGILGLASLLEDTQLDSDQRELVDSLSSSGTLLRRLIDDLLVFSKLDSGKLTLEQRSFDLHQALEGSLDWVRTACQEKGLLLHAIVHPCVPKMALGDEQRLQQILANLLSNAVKFTERGEVRLRARCEHDESGFWLDVAVMDSGKGIEAEAQAEIFQPFRQEDSSISRRFGGTGLGLAICRELCAAMGGSIHLRSRVGHGSRFRFRVRLDEILHLEEPLPLQGKRVAIYSPYASTRRSLQFRLQAMGAEVSGETAQPGDALLLDGDHPEARQLLERAACGDLCPVAWIEPLEGWSDVPLEYIQEPSILRLTRTSPSQRWIEHLANPGACQRQAPVPQHPQATEAPTPRPTTILLVDDNPVNRLVGKRLVERLGYSVLQAESGQRGLELLEEHEVHLVLLDLQMPDLDGFQTWDRIRSRYSVPVVALTADLRTETRERCRKVGMSGYLPKPIEVDKLEDILTKQLQGRLAS